MARTPRYRIPFFQAGLVFSLAALASGLAVRFLPEESAWRLPLILGPVLPAAGLLALLLRYLIRGDELEQRIQLLAAVTALLITFLFTLTCGLLESYAGIEPIGGIWTALLILVSWTMAGNILRRRYR